MGNMASSAGRLGRQRPADTRNLVAQLPKGCDGTPYYPLQGVPLQGKGDVWIATGQRGTREKEEDWVGASY